MKHKSDYLTSDWESAKKKVRKLLIKRAQEKRLISYLEVTQSISSLEMEPNSNALADLLGEVSDEENNNGRGMLSSIVVRRINNVYGWPGRGFFRLARGLGRTGTDEEIWSREVSRIHDENPRQMIR